MTLQDAEKIVQEYGSVLADEDPDDRPASYASSLLHSPERIIQAMKLWLAHNIQYGSLTEETRNVIGTTASRLPYFIEDEEARHLNTIYRSNYPSVRDDLATKDVLARAKALQEVYEWSTNASMAGLSLRYELDDFIAAVEKYDPVDSLYWQRVYTLAGIEYSPKSKRSFWDLFS